MYSEQTAVVQWNSLNAYKVRLSYSIDGGITYPYTITDAISGVAGSYKWTVPVGIRSNCARIRADVLGADDKIMAESESAEFTIWYASLFADWDIDENGVTDVSDLVLLGRFFNQRKPDNPRADVNTDGKVDLLDLVIVAQHFGESTLLAAPDGDPWTVDKASVVVLKYLHQNLVNSAVQDNDVLTAKRLLERLIAANRQVVVSRLLVNYPNPFNPETWIPYELAEDSDVVIRIYSVSGSLVRTLRLGYRHAGVYSFKGKAAHWDGRNQSGESAASGIYYYAIQAGDFTSIRKMILAK